jgi:hypothetical protein
MSLVRCDWPVDPGRVRAPRQADTSKRPTGVVRALRFRCTCRACAQLWMDTLMSAVWTGSCQRFGRLRVSGRGRRRSRSPALPLRGAKAGAEHAGVACFCWSSNSVVIIGPNGSSETTALWATRACIGLSLFRECERLAEARNHRHHPRLHEEGGAAHQPPGRFAGRPGRAPRNGLVPSPRCTRRGGRDCGAT